MKEKNIPWLALFFLACAVVSYALINGSSNNYVVYSTVGYGGSGVVPPAMMESSGSVSNAPVRDMIAPATPAMAPEMNAKYYPYPQPYQNGSTPVTDTREFNKVSYGATMMTRGVQELVKRVVTVIRGYDGRVDQTSSSPQSGYISFVVPVTKFDAFRDEIEGLVDSRFLSVNIQSENLLPQKQNIEQQQKYAEMSLSDLQSARKKAVADYSSTKKSLQSQIDADTQQLHALQKEVTNDPGRQNQIAALELQLQGSISSLSSRLTSASVSYTSNINAIDTQIQYANQNLAGVKQQDQNLLDNVATVQGSISIQWISISQIILLYLPGNSIPGIFLLLSILSYLWHRFKEKSV